MKDPRIRQMAELLINYSVKLQPGEKLLIENTGIQQALVSAIVDEAYKAGGQPFVNLKDPKVHRSLLRGATKEQLEAWEKYESTVMEEMDAYIAIRSGDNINELSDVPSEKINYTVKRSEMYTETFAFQKQNGVSFAIQMNRWHNLPK